MKSDSYYRDLLLDVLDDVPPAIDSPAIAHARWAVDEELLSRTGRAPDTHYRDQLADVVGDVWAAPHSSAIEAAHEALVAERPQAEAELSSEATRVLAHIRARTEVGKFATGLQDMPQARWRAALEELERAGHRIEWTLGTVADDPPVTGGYVLREPAKRERSRDDVGLEL